MYSPLIGQFAQRDPLGYAAGDANLLRYCENRSVNATDPSGLAIVSHCNLDKYLNRYLSINNGLRDQQGLDGDYHYGNLGGSVSRFDYSLESLILYAMIHSAYEFRVAGTTNDTSLANIKKHVDTRVRIVTLARGMISGFGENETATVVQAVREQRVEPREYYNQVNNPDTIFACRKGATLPFFAGIENWSDFATRAISQRPDSWQDWIPGDWGYIENKSWQTWGAKLPGVPGWSSIYAGENIICVDRDLYWVHTATQNDVRPMQEWFEEIKSWTYTTPPEWTADYYGWFTISWGSKTIHGEPEIRNSVNFPTVGLETKK